VADAILVVEDDPTLGPLLVSVLEAGGHGTVLLAADAPYAHGAVDRFGGEVAVLVVDVGLPSQRGDQLAHELAARFPGLRVVLMSGHVDERARPPGTPDSWLSLTKPFTAAQLLATVASLSATK
jgi:DNA-binding NtrC family response regulator